MGVVILPKAATSNTVLLCYNWTATANTGQKKSAEKASPSHFWVDCFASVFNQSCHPTFEHLIIDK